MTRRSHQHGLLLAPGAGADSSAPALLAVEQALGSRWLVRRMDFPYRLAGRRAPDKPAVLLEAMRKEMDALALDSGLPATKLFAGGRSMGGRIASMAVAGGMQAAGLVLLSYPLHPPGKPDKLRTEHFSQLRVPCLFVSGTRDAFGTAEEFIAHTKAIPAPVEHRWIEGGDHGMRNYSEEVATSVASWLVNLTA